MGLLDWLMPPNPATLKEARDVDGLLKALTHRPRKAVRAEAADALGELGDHRAAEPLMAALGDEAANVREAAACALGKLREEKAQGRLVAALADGEVSVRVAAVRALGKLGDDKAVEPLLACLESDDNRILLATRDALQRWKGEERVGAALRRAEDSLRDRRHRRASGWWKGVAAISSKSCDVCNNPVARDTGYLLDSFEMVDSDDYLDYAVSQRKRQQRLAGQMQIPGLDSFTANLMLEPVLKLQVILDVRRTTTPWLVCEACSGCYFTAKA